MKNRIKAGTLLIAAVALTFSIILGNTSEAVVPNESTVISLNNSGDGQGGNGNSSSPIVSADGRYTAFSSVASNLVSGDTNGKKDVFVRDMVNNSTARISVSSSSVEGNDDSEIRAISKTGRYVAFSSAASNLIDGETNSVGSGNFDVYIRDTQTNTTTMINKNSSGSRVYKVYPTGISDDGRFISVETTSSNLLAGYTTSNQRKAALLDRSTNSWTFLSLINQGLGFEYWNNVQANCDEAIVAVSTPSGIEVFDRRDSSEAVNITASGNNDSMNPRVSCDGRYIGFDTWATNLVAGITPSDGYKHLVRYDRVTGEYVYLDVDSSGNFLPRYTSDPNSVSYALSLADNGGVAFALLGSNYPYYTQAYIRNVAANSTEIITRRATTGSTSTSYQQTTGYRLGLDMDGKYVVYQAEDSSQIIDNETNGYVDVIRSKTGW